MVSEKKNLSERVLITGVPLEMLLGSKQSFMHMSFLTRVSRKTHTDPTSSVFRFLSLLLPVFAGFQYKYIYIFVPMIGLISDLMGNTYKRYAQLSSTIFKPEFEFESFWEPYKRFLMGDFFSLSKNRC